MAVALKKMILVCILMFLYPRNPLKTKSDTYDQYLPPKSKMAAKFDEWILNYRYKNGFWT